MVKKNFKIIAFLNIGLLIIGILLGHYSELYRIYKPLYPILKMISWGILITSLMWSLINTLFIYHHIKNNLIKNLKWLLVSVIPLVCFFIIGIMTLMYLLI